MHLFYWCGRMLALRIVILFLSIFDLWNLVFLLASVGDFSFVWFIPVLFERPAPLMLRIWASCLPQTLFRSTSSLLQLDWIRQPQVLP